MDGGNLRGGILFPNGEKPVCPNNSFLHTPNPNDEIEIVLRKKYQFIKYINNKVFQNRPVGIETCHWLQSRLKMTDESLLILTAIGMGYGITCLAQTHFF